MKSIRRLAAVMLLGFATVAGAQLKMPDPNAPGGSMNTAVRIVATSDLMIDRSITRWLRKNYPGWDADPHEFQQIGNERYAVVYITHPDNPGRRVYFRVVSSYADPDDGVGSPF
jgi:hypothetical protein